MGRIKMSGVQFTSSVILAFFAVASFGQDLPPECLDVPRECGAEILHCVSDPVCLKSLTCLGTCDASDAECAYTCGMYAEDNQAFLDFMQCSADVGCMPDYPEDGVCLATPDQALQYITDLDQVKGEWWMLRGANCGQEGWPGGYDWYPCQHSRIIDLEDEDRWINNQTYCAGSNSPCSSEIFVTTADAYMLSPGVSRNDYPVGQAPIVPQLEDWHWISFPDPDWAFVAWCGTNPALDYNGALILSRHRNYDLLTPEVEAELRAAVASVGLDWDSMCATDNTDCPF